MDVAGDKDIKIDNLLVGGTAKTEKVIAPKGRWVDYSYTVLLLANVFRFAACLSKAFEDDEQVSWNAEARNIRGTVLSLDASLPSLSRPCAAPNAELSRTTTAKDFRNNWKESCADFCHRFLGFYQVEGDTYLAKPTIKARIDSLTRPFESEDAKLLA